MGRRKQFTGEVISDRMQKTRVVRVVRLSKHPKYNRVTKHSNKFKAHDETGAAKTGDIVRIIETRPLSKDKRFRIAEIVRKAQRIHAATSGAGPAAVACSPNSPVREDIQAGVAEIGGEQK